RFVLSQRPVTTGDSPRTRSAIFSGVIGARSVMNPVSPGASSIVVFAALPSPMFGFVASASVAATAALGALVTAMFCGVFWSVQATEIGVVEFFVTMTWSGACVLLLP